MICGQRLVVHDDDCDDTRWWRVKEHIVCLRAGEIVDASLNNNTVATYGDTTDVEFSLESITLCI
mgnify:CR=1 FL=1